MADQWEWDTLMAINEERKKHRVPPLKWCHEMEEHARLHSQSMKLHLSPDGTRLTYGGFIEGLVKSEPRFGTCWSWCPHWTPHEVIAGGLLANPFHRTHLLSRKVKSAAVAIRNDEYVTYVTLSYSEESPKSSDWVRQEELQRKPPRDFWGMYE